MNYASIFITAIRLSQTNGTHEHITNVWWDYSNPQYAAGQQNMSVAQAVAWLRESTANKAMVRNLVENVTVEVIPVDRPNGPPFLRTKPDRTMKDNLLSLPRIS